MSDIVQRIARWRDSGVGMVMDLLPDAQVELIRLRAERDAALARAGRLDDTNAALRAERDAALERAECLLASQAPDLSRTPPALAHGEALARIAGLEAALRALIEPFALISDAGLLQYPDTPQPIAILAARAALADAPGEPDE